MSAINRSRILLRLLCLAFVASLAAPAAAFAMAPDQSNSKDKKEKNKEKDSADDDDDEPMSKDFRNYQKLKQFSLDEYQKDAAFRLEVDSSYRDLQREHSNYAYSINMRDADDDHVTHTGDKVKIEDALYDNPLVQDYVNRLGHSIVPTTSQKLYAFRVVLSPVPEARALSTGTVYVSTGLLSLVNNEAQLAYVLGHEIAHVEKEHWREDVLVQHGIDRYNRKQHRRRTILGGIANIGASIVGSSAGPLTKTELAAEYARLAVPTILKLAVPDATASWDKRQEDEADELGLKLMFARSYDPREVPKFYAGLQDVASKEQRSTVGFMADPTRLAERAAEVTTAIAALGPLGGSLLVGAVSLGGPHQPALTAPPQSVPRPAPGKQLALSDANGERADAANRALVHEMAPDLKNKLDAKELIGSSAEFEAVMAELKRDNGIRALYFDMFYMARSNLEESIMIRSDDPYAHFYYGKVLKLTAKSTSEKLTARQEFAKAINFDRRQVLAEPYLHRALSLMEVRDQSMTPEIVASLKNYVQVYQRMNGGKLPPNMDAIYDYLQETGELGWSAAPVVPTLESTPIHSTAPPTAAVPKQQTPERPDTPAVPARNKRRRS